MNNNFQAFLNGFLTSFLNPGTWLIGIILFAFLLLTSCNKYSLPVATKQVEKAHIHYSDMVAEKTRSWYPCIITQSDTITRIDTTYSYIEVQCPDTIAYRVDSFESVYSVKVPVYVRVPCPQSVKTITIEEKVEDSAKIKILSGTILNQNEKIGELEKDKADLQKKIKRKNKWLTWVSIIGGLGWLFIGALVYFKIKM